MSGPAAQIRAYLAAHPKGGLRALYKAHPHWTVRQICAVLDGLEDKGELTITDGYTYTPAETNQRAAGKQARIWAAVRALGQSQSTITAAEIARLADATNDYTRRYLAYLAQTGRLVKRRNGYGLNPQAPLEAPHWNRRRVEKEATK